MEDEKEQEVDVLAEIDDPQIREIVGKSDAAKGVTLDAMAYVVDSTALATARKLMTDPEVPAAVKRDMTIGWLHNRREMRKIVDGQGAKTSDFTVNISFGSQGGEDHERTRRAFGVRSDVDDAPTE